MRTRSIAVAETQMFGQDLIAAMAEAAAIAQGTAKAARIHVIKVADARAIREGLRLSQQVCQRL